LSKLFHPNTHTKDLPKIGGKGRNLYQLQQPHNVPDWVALPVDYFDSCLETARATTPIQTLIDQLTDQNAAETAEQIQAIILSLPLPSDLIPELEKCFPEGFVSVRSSAADEDGTRHSFAGIHESYLYVKGGTAIADHIRKVWASGYQERALLYRRTNHLPLHPVPMAVLVQRMIEAHSSGVVFTADPATKNPHQMIISALYGLGEGLVSAGLDADHIEYNKRTRTFNATIATKPTQYTFNATEGAGVGEHPVDHARQEQPTLQDQQIHELAHAARLIETQQRRPQDIEFCFDTHGKLFILQTRDITTIDEDGPAAGNPQIWDNSNIVESYSGVTSPMTFSFIRHAYAVVYHCFSEVMSIPPKVVEENQGVYRNMLGLFQGQVYYNLPNWYRLVQQFPGYEYNKAFMESMMGVKYKADTGEAPKQASHFRRYCIELPRLLQLLVRMLHRFMKLHRLVPAFNRHFNHYYDQWAALDFRKLPPHELMKIYHGMEKHLLRNWKTPIINDFYVMMFYGALKGCCTRWCNDTNATLQNNLICGEGDIESTVPTRTLMHLATQIKADPEITALFTTHAPEVLLETIPQQYPWIADTIADYLDKYGFRCMNELKLEEPSLHETPEFVYQIIANYVRMDSSLLDVSAMEAHEKKVRTDAEKLAFSKIFGLREMLFRFVLKHARRGVKNRENMRFARTKIYGQLRELLNAVGGTLQREGIIDAEADIYYLGIDEVWDYVKGTAITTDLRGLIALRRQEFDGYRAAERDPDDHFETYGMAYHRNQFKNPEAATEPVADDGTLRGIGCSPGTVEGVARVIQSPRDNVSLNGEILVAGRTDPGWVPLYPAVSGILIERGSILSHSAIVAREMGIPAIVGIPHLLDTIKDGQTLRMDAATGTITPT
jgi:phosphohistidine swiveling domain-containing protein